MLFYKDLLACLYPPFPHNISSLQCYSFTETKHKLYTYQPDNCFQQVSTLIVFCGDIFKLDFSLISLAELLEREM